MPFLEEMTWHNATIGIWSLSESQIEMEEMISLNEQERIEYESFKSERRKREFLAVRALLHIIFPQPVEISHDNDGRPFLRGTERTISISHSRNLVAVILAGNPAGIDAEETDRNIAEVAPRFLSEKELNWTSLSADHRLSKIFCWSCKESAYKMLGDKEIDFRDHFLILPVDLKIEGSAELLLLKNGKKESIEIFYRFIEGNVVTWCQR